VWPFVLRDFMSDIYFADANNWVSTADLEITNPDMQYRILTRYAAPEYRQAMHLNIFNGPAYEGLILTVLKLGSMDFSKWKQAQARHDDKLAEFLRKGAQRNFGAAVSLSDAQLRSMGDVGYHTTYY